MGPQSTTSGREFATTASTITLGKLFLQEGVDDNETLLQRKRVGHYSPHKAQQRLDTRWQTDHDAVDVVKSELVSN